VDRFWLGIGAASKVALAFILVAVPIFFAVFTGIRQVDQRLVERIITLGGKRRDLVRHVYLPSVAVWRVCRGDPRTRLSPVLCAEHPQRGSDVSAGGPDHDCRIADLRNCWKAGKTLATMELTVKTRNRATSLLG